MKKFLLLSLLFSLLIFANCHFTGDFDINGDAVKGSGVEKSEKREMGAFNTIDLACLAKVNITCQDKQSIDITADDNILPLLQTEVKNNTLYIKASKNYNPKSKVQLDIKVPNIEKLALSGVGEMTLTNLKNDKLDLDVSGAGALTTAGETGMLQIKLSGAGRIDAKDLHANKASVDASGAGSVSLYATEQLDADVSGVGSVNYYGNPKTVNKKVSGVGSINAK